MTSRSSPARRRVPPISRHPAFPALICLWLAALCGLAIWVVPIDYLRAGLDGSAMGPLAQQSHGLLAVIAALSGAAMGMLAVHLLRQPPRGPASPGHASEGTARRAGAPRHNASPSRTTQVLQLAELHLSPDNAEDPRLPGGVDTPALAARHGAAVVKLRSKALSELSLIELTERLAVALEDLRVAGAGAPWASGERAEPRSAASLQERAESGESALRHAMQKLQQMADAA